MTSWFCTCAETESLKRMKAMKRVQQVNTQKKLSLSLKKRKKEPIDGHFSQELFVGLPHIAESVSCGSLLLVPIVLFFFDVSVRYRIYYMYHGFSVYMANIRPSHLDIGPRLRLRPISRCSCLIFAIHCISLEAMVYILHIYYYIY